MQTGSMTAEGAITNSHKLSFNCRYSSLNNHQASARTTSSGQNSKVVVRMQERELSLPALGMVIKVLLHSNTPSKR